MFEDYFLLLPESYDSARTSELQFLAEYLGDDAGQDMEITFNEEVGQELRKLLLRIYL